VATHFLLLPGGGLLYNWPKQESFMRLPRLLILSSLFSLCVATATAQVSSDKSPDSSQLPPVLFENGHASPDLFQFPLPFSVAELNVSDIAPDAKTSDHDRTVIPLKNFPRLHILTLGQDETTCLTLRTYRVARVDPESDATRPASYSTCQPSVRFQLKAAVDSREIVVR
jgi:hypothetical protein